MAYQQVKPPDLPKFLTWEELEQLPEEVAGQIELWEGRVVWVRRGPSGHQTCSRRVTQALEVAARKAMADQPEQCWRVELETNVFLGSSNKSDFLTPDFLVFRCPESLDSDTYAEDVLLAGEVLSPSNTHSYMEAKKGRYAGAGIPWYWEVDLTTQASGIAMVRAYALQTAPAQLPDGVQPLRRTHYVEVEEWTHDDPEGITIDFPFPIRLPWSELEF